jgi:hypothetical protein
MPIQSYSTLVKMSQYCRVAVPKAVHDRLDSINKMNDEEVKLLGCEIAAHMCTQIYEASNGDIDGVHFYTLNLERSVTEIIGMLRSMVLDPAFHPEITEPRTQKHLFSSTTAARNRREQDKNERPLPWTTSLGTERPNEEVRYVRIKLDVLHLATVRSLLTLFHVSQFLFFLSAQSIGPIGQNHMLRERKTGMNSLMAGTN